MASIEERVKEVVAQHLNVAKSDVTREKNFITDFQADSLDLVELVMELEEEFDIQIPEDEADKIKTVGDAIDFIESHQ